MISMVAILGGFLSMMIASVESKQCWVRVWQIVGEIDNIDGPGATIDPYFKYYGYNPGSSPVWRCNTDVDWNDVTPDFWDSETCYVGGYQRCRLILMDHDPDTDDADDYLGYADLDMGDFHCDDNGNIWYGPYIQHVPSDYGHLDVKYYYKCQC